MNSEGMGFSWLVFLILILTIIYFINRLIAEDSSAKDILDRRYANGEIDESEYKKMRTLLH